MFYCISFVYTVYYRYYTTVNKVARKNTEEKQERKACLARVEEKEGIGGQLTVLSLSYLERVEEEEGRGGLLTVPQYHYPTWRGLRRRKGEVDRSQFRNITILPGEG